MAIPGRSLFGIHSVTPYSRTDGTPYGILKVLAGSSVSITGENIKLMGGSNKYPWAVEDGAVTVEMSLKVRELPDFLFELFLGIAPTLNAAETSGNCSTLTNKYGTSVKATTGIASATILSGSKTNAKFGKYTVVAVSSTTVDVYLSTDVDFLRGTDGSYTTDDCKILAAQAITQSTATDFAAYGFSLTGDSGTIGMTIGDSATFEIRPVNTASSTATVGASGSVNPEFGCLVYSQKRGTGEMFELDLLRCKGVGLPLGFEEFKWAEHEIKVDGFYDSTANAVLYMRSVTPSTVA